MPSPKRRKPIPIVYKTIPAKEYTSRLEDFILRKFPNFSPLKGDLQLSMVVHPGTARKEDVDNRVKCLLDSLEGVLFENDHQVKVLHVEMGEPISPGFVDIIIQEKGAK